MTSVMLETPIKISMIYKILFLDFLLIETLEVATQPNDIIQTTATLGQARSNLAATSLGELVFFGGGLSATGASDRVDISNVTTGSWTTVTLSVPRAYLAAASSGNLVFFAGGWNGTTFYNQVDIYNVSNGSWSTATLTQARYALAGTSVGNLVLFGGGFNYTSWSNVVDIYNVATNTWTTATLSQARSLLAATSVSNRLALFAGGQGYSSNTVDIFDSVTGNWSTATLSQGRAYLAATSLSNLAFFGGGSDGTQPLNVVDIFNSTTQTWHTATLSQARSALAAAAIDMIVAFGGGWSNTTVSSVVDVYNVTSNLWFTGTLSQARADLAAASSTNQIFFGGGSWSSQFIVDILELELPSSSPPSSTSLPSSQNFSSQAPAVITNPTLTTGLSHLTAPRPNTLPTGAIVGIVVGISALLIAIGLILFLVLFIKRRRQRNATSHHIVPQQHTITPSQQTTNYIAISPRQKLQNETFNQTQTQTQMQTHTQTQTQTQTQTRILRPPQSVTKYTEVPYNEILIDKDLGEGSYGKVCLGKWNAAPVALKFSTSKCRSRLWNFCGWTPTSYHFGILWRRYLSALLMSSVLI